MVEEEAASWQAVEEEQLAPRVVDEQAASRVEEEAASCTACNSPVAPLVRGIVLATGKLPARGLLSVVGYEGSEVLA